MGKRKAAHEPNVKVGTNDKVGRRVFTADEERQFIYCLYDYVGSNGKADNGFKPGYVNELTKMLNKRFPEQPTPFLPKNINSKIVAWKKDYGVIQYLLGLSGIGWGDESRQIVCEDDVWENAVRANNDCKNYRYKVWTYYEDWVSLFGKDRATGSEAVDFADVVVDIRKEDQVKDNIPAVQGPKLEEDITNKPMLYLLTSEDIKPKDYTSDYESDSFEIMMTPPSNYYSFDSESGGASATSKYKAPRMKDDRSSKKERIELKRESSDVNEEINEMQRDYHDLKEEKVLKKEGVDGKDSVESLKRKAKLPSGKKVKQEDSLIPAIKGFLDDAKVNYMSLTPSFMKETDSREETRKKVMMALEKILGWIDEDVITVCYKIMDNPNHLAMFMGCDQVRREKHAKLIKACKI